MNIILLGPPGSGKGTLAGSIVKEHKIPHISTGDILRDNVKRGTELGLKAQEYMNRGDLVPDGLVVEIAVARLKEDDCKDGFMLDGFPRTVYQAEELRKFLEKEGKKIDYVFNLEAPKEMLVNRLVGRRVCRNCGAIYHVENMKPKVEGVCDICGGELYQRKDDNRLTVENRIDIHRKQTEPLIDYYRNQGNLVDLDGSIDKNVLAKDIDERFF